MKLTEVNVDNLDRPRRLLEHDIQMLQRTCNSPHTRLWKRRVHEGSSREGTVGSMFDSVNLSRDLGRVSFPHRKIVELGVVEPWKHTDEEDSPSNARSSMK
jgi:hypothetical protein